MMKFNEKYNAENFRQFLLEFLPKDFSEKEEDIVINKDRYKVITNTKVLGSCGSLDDLYVLEMEHDRERDPRVTITTDAFKILADNWIHRALVVFRNKDTENYRLSYLTITLDLNDENKAVKKYSNARRYSFYLGVNAKARTPEQQLIKKGRVKDIEDLLSRFSVEVVNRQFYLEVAKFFDELVSGKDKNLSLPSVSQENVNVRKSFAVRLIGRLMFCWFLKQKKSMSGQLIPDELLSSHAARKSSGYYHGVLEPLFFEVLNTNIDARGIRSESFDKVPYLNGGLFNPQLEDYYELDRDTFNSKYINTLSVSDKWFVEFFELLELYNFTIDENTVFDQELSVDPEMLGRIFENLLAEMNPDTGSSERKRTGSFYTPRQIVEYMVDKSLIEYLKKKVDIEEGRLIALVSYDLDDDANHLLSDEEKQKIVTAIETLKILDPACGSGAYPMGALQKIVFILQIVDPNCDLWLEEKLKNVPELYKQKIVNEFKLNPFNYTRKLDVIKNSIFGVDIQPIAVDVSRLRCFLTLVVESDIDDARPNRGIEPLPNLDFKFVCANSLISAPEQSNTNDSLFGDDFQERLTIAVDKYFQSAGENKRSANNEIHKLIDGKVDDKLQLLTGLVSYHGDEKLEAARAKKNNKMVKKHSRILSLWGSYKNIFENKPVEFFETKYFFPSVKSGFDIVIGNPPYVSTKGVSDEQKVYLADLYGFSDDLYSHFYFRGLQLCVDGGVLSYITSKTFWTIQTKKNLRELLLKNNLIYIYDTDNPFESAMVDTCVVMVCKESEQKQDTLFLKSTANYLNPICNKVDKSVYENTVNKVIFYPTSDNLNVYKKFSYTVSELMERWWPYISTSKNITKNSAQLEIYRENLNPGDLTLLGLITDGGQGLATGSNGNYVGVLSTTKEAIRVKEMRANKFFDFVTSKKIIKYGSDKESIRAYLNGLSEEKIRDLFDSLKREYGRDIFGQGFLYRIVDQSEIKDVGTMTSAERQFGLSGSKTFVPYDKGDKDGNRWFLFTPYYIDWSKENVDILKRDPKARYQGHQFYFRAGFCWSDIHTVLIKARLKSHSIHDIKSMSMFSLLEKCPDKYLVALLNSTFISNYDFSFVNSTQTFQINDARQIPIIIPTNKQLSEFEHLFDRAYAIKVSQFDGEIAKTDAEKYLLEIQKELDDMVLSLYGLL